MQPKILTTAWFLNSLRAKIAALFAIALAAIVVLFLAVNGALKQKEINAELAKLSLIAQSVSNFSNDADTTNKYLAEVGFRRLGPHCTHKITALNLQPILTHIASFGSINAYFARKGFYLEIVDDKGPRLYKSPSKMNSYKTILISSCVLVALVLAALFALINIGLRPLGELARAMKSWSQAGGGEAMNFQIRRNDEIGHLARECVAATKRVDNLICSRQLFLRSIMHELKTPIGKGRIIAALPPSAANASRLDAVFTRLELLVNEFGQAERVLSRYCEPQMSDYRCSLIYEQAMDILMLDDASSIVPDFGDDPIIRVDLQLFSLMLKNLIDNAIKYSTGGPIFVSFLPDALVVQNRGEALTDSIEELMQAFRQGDSQKPGLGLGMYLIARIARLHGCRLVHSFDGRTHSFKIVPEKAPKKRLQAAEKEGGGGSGFGA